MIDRSPRSGISRKRNRRSAAQPARAGRVGLNVGRSADRRRWLGAPLAHEDSARTRVTGFDNADLSMPPVWRYPVTPSARPAPRRPHDRSFAPKRNIAKTKWRSAAQPARAGRVGLNVGRSADRRRWLGAPLAHEDSARIRVTGFDNADLSMPPVWRYPVTPSARPAPRRPHDRSFAPKRNIAKTKSAKRRPAGSQRVGSV